MECLGFTYVFLHHPTVYVEPVLMDLFIFLNYPRYIYLRIIHDQIVSIPQRIDKINFGIYSVSL